jgi:hypothetical protein
MQEEARTGQSTDTENPWKIGGWGNPGGENEGRLLNVCRGEKLWTETEVGLQEMRLVWSVHAVTHLRRKQKNARWAVGQGQASRWLAISSLPLVEALYGSMQDL